MGRDRPPGHPDCRGRQRAADRPAAARRQGGSGGLRLLRFLGLHRRRGIGAARLVCAALSGPPGYRFHQPAIVFPSLCAAVRRGGDRHRAGDLGAHQPRQSRGQHPADPAAGDADPEKRAPTTSSNRWRCAGCRGPDRPIRRRHSGMVRQHQTRISRFRVRCFEASPRNDVGPHVTRCREAASRRARRRACRDRAA